MKRLPIALVLVLAACAHRGTPAERLTVPPRSTAYSISITALGSSVDDLESAIETSIAINPEIVRVDLASPASEGHVDLTVHAVGTPLVDANCSAEARAVVRRAFGPPILDETQQFAAPCGWNGSALDELYAQAVGWGLSRAITAIAQPDTSGGEAPR